MYYQEFKPSPLLAQYVHSYWVSSKGKSSRILPDGLVDVIFNFGKATSTLPYWNAGVVGMMTKFRDVTIDKGTELIGIRFRPMHFHKWSKVSLNELKNITVQASDINSNWDHQLVAQIYQQGTIQDKLAFIEHNLLATIDETPLSRSPIISSVCNAISTSFTGLSLSTIAKDHYISLRQLERLFKAQVGVSMKEYQSIIRFIHTLKNLTQYPNKSLLHLAYDMGYFDHAHLTQEIKKVAGIPPSQLK